MDTARTKRLMLVVLFIFLTLAGTTALVFQPIMKLINKNITVVREEIIKKAEEFLHRPIHYSSMGPSIINTIEIRDLAVGDEENLLVAAARLYLEYSLLDIIRGKGIGAFRNLILEDPEFSFDTERDGDLIELFSEIQEEPSAKPQKIELPLECSINVHNGIIFIAGGNTPFSVTGVFLNAEIKDHWVNLEGEWHKDLAMDGRITLEGSVNGNFSDKFNRGRLDLTIDSIESKNFIAARIGFLLSFFEDRIVFERENDSLPLYLSAEYFRATGDFSGSFRADNFYSSSLVHFKGPLENFSPILSLAISGNAGLFAGGNRDKNDNSENNIVYNFAVSGTASHDVSNLPVKSFTIEGEGNEKQLTLSRFIINAKRGSAEYSGDILFNPLLAQGTFNFSDFSITGDTSVNGNILFSGTEEGLNIDSSYLSFGNTVLASFGGKLSSKNGRSDYVIGFDCFHGKDKTILKTSFECSGFHTKKTGQLEGMAEFSGFYIDDLLNMARPFFALGSSFTGAAQKTAVTAEIGFNTDFSGFNYQSGNFKVVYAPETVITASVKGNERQLELTNGTVRLKQEKVSFDFSADFSRPDDLNFLCSFGYLDFNYSFEGRRRNQNIFTLRGDHDFSATAIKEEGRWSGSVTGRNIPIPYRGSHSLLSLEAGVVYLNSASWNFRLDQFEIREQAGKIALYTQGQASQNGINLDRIFYSDRVGALEGSAAAIWNSDFSFIDASVFLSDRNETEKLAADIFYESGNIEFHGNVNGFKAERIAPGARNFLATGEIYGGLSPDGYYLLNLSLQSLSGRIKDKDFELSGLALLDPEKLIISQSLCIFGGIQSNIPFISLDRNAGMLETEVQISGIVNDQEFGMLLSLGCNFQPMKTWFDSESLESISGILNVRYAYINKKEITEPFSFVFTRTPLMDAELTTEKSPALYRLSGGPNDMLDAEFRENSPGNGVVSLSLGYPFPVQGFITGFLEGTNIDALASEVVIDLHGLWELLPMNKIVDFTGGMITGETRVFGSIFDPEFEGKAWGAGITLIVPDYIAAEIGPGSGIITLEGSGFSFGPVNAPCEDGHGIINASFSFNRWKSSFDLNIGVDRSIPFDFNLSGVMARGDADGVINIFLEENELLTITGDIHADNTEITLNKDEMDAALAGMGKVPGPDIVTDVKLTSGKRVEFLWPNSRTPLLRAYCEADTKILVSSDTRVPMFALEGDIVLRGGELYHLARSFYIREGQLQFFGNDPNMEPLISARAEIRDYNEDGPVTIYMIMEKVPLSEFERTMPRYESVPSLSQLEIYGILGQAPLMDNVPDTASSSSRSSTEVLIRSGTDVLIHTLVFRRVERGIRNIFGLDMFSFRTQVIQNAIYEAARSRNRSPDDPPATVGNYLDNTAVFMGKYFLPNMFGQLIFAFRYNPNQREFGGMKPELDLGLDFRTPLFDIRWNVHPEYPEYILTSRWMEEFVGHQSISLVWRWSL